MYIKDETKSKSTKTLSTYFIYSIFILLTFQCQTDIVEFKSKFKIGKTEVF